MCASYYILQPAIAHNNDGSIRPRCPQIRGCEVLQPFNLEALVLFSPPQIPHDMTKARTRAASAGIQRLTAELWHGHISFIANFQAIG